MSRVRRFPPARTRPRNSDFIPDLLGEFTTKLESRKGIIFSESIASEIDKRLAKDGKTMRREELQKMHKDYYALSKWLNEKPYNFGQFP
jgi:hypothetical protein